MLRKKWIHLMVVLMIVTFLPRMSDADEVPRVHTPIGRLELAAVLRDGHYAAFGHFPDKKRLAVAWAQVALENGQGKKVWNHNLGMVTSKKDRPYYVKRHRFKAHRTFVDGAKDYWETVDWLCPQAFRYFDKGQPYSAALVLRSCGYYGADSKRYGRAMIQLYHLANVRVLPRL